jgi:hypothetical protein
MERSELKEKLSELKKKIKANSKEAKFATQLVEELLLTQRMIDKEPLHTYDLGAEIDRLEGQTFYIAKHEKGALYHVYNSYDLVVQPSQLALYDTLVSLVENKEANAKLVGEEKENFENYMSVVSYVLSTPAYALSDAELSVEIATVIVKHLNKVYEKLMNQPLQEATPKEDQEFKEATLAVEEVKEALKDEQ